MKNLQLQKLLTEKTWKTTKKISSTQRRDIEKILNENSNHLTTYEKQEKDLAIKNEIVY